LTHSSRVTDSGPRGAEIASYLRSSSSFCTCCTSRTCHDRQGARTNLFRSLTSLK